VLCLFKTAPLYISQHLDDFKNKVAVESGPVMLVFGNTSDQCMIGGCRHSLYPCSVIYFREIFLQKGRSQVVPPSCNKQVDVEKTECALAGQVTDVSTRNSL
jgi:hypothetical protein